MSDPAAFRSQSEIRLISRRATGAGVTLLYRRNRATASVEPTVRIPRASASASVSGAGNGRREGRKQTSSFP